MKRRGVTLRLYLRPGAVGRSWMRSSVGVKIWDWFRVALSCNSLREESLPVHSENVLLSVLLRKYGNNTTTDLPPAQRTADMFQVWRIEMKFGILWSSTGTFRNFLSRIQKFASAICWTIWDVCEVDFTGFSSDKFISLGDKFNSTGILLRIKGACTLTWWTNH